MKSGERKQGTRAGSLPRQASGTLAVRPQPLAFRPRLHRFAFTLLEMIGALAVIALISAALFPVVIRQIDRAAKTAETQNMQAISSNFVAYVRSTWTIPSPNPSGWGAAVATYMNKPASAITSNSRGVSRILLYDKFGWLGTNSHSSLYPYTQGAGGFVFTPGTPGLARVLIVSSIDASTKNQLPSLGGNDFQTTWDWDPAADPRVPTTGAWAGWPGNGYDVVIQRISLDTLFHRVLLSSTNSPFIYSINGTLGAATGKFEGYFVDGSVLGLYNSAGVLQTAELISSDLSRFYLGPANVPPWSDQPGPGPPTQTSISLDNLTALFAGSPAAPQDPRGDNTYGAAAGMIAYMTAYASWASMSPCFSYGGSGNINLSAQYNAMNTVIGCFQTGNGGGNGNGSTSGCQIVPLK